MPTLYVENIPNELYEALRRQARAGHRSIAREVIALLERSVPTDDELRARRSWLRQLERSRKQRTRSRVRFPSTEEMQRKDRER